MNIKKILLPLAAALLLCGCAGKTDPAIVWQKTLANSGATVALSNCTAAESETQFYLDTAGEATTLPLVTADHIPVLTVTGATPEQVFIRYATPYETGMRLYDLNEPSEKVDYIATVLADGSPQYRIETVYFYYITVTTNTGADSFVLQCTRQV